MSWGRENTNNDRIMHCACTHVHVRENQWVCGEINQTPGRHADVAATRIKGALEKSPLICSNANQFIIPEAHCKNPLITSKGWQRFLLLQHFPYTSISTHTRTPLATFLVFLLGWWSEEIKSICSWQSVGIKKAKASSQSSTYDSSYSHS